MQTSLKQKAFSTPHNHLKKLTSSETSTQTYTASILFQQNSSKSFLTIASIIQNRNSADLLFYVTGPSSSSKTALSYTLSSHLGDRYPFLPISSAELNTSSYSSLLSLLRKSISIRLREIKETYEGEVISFGFSPSPSNPSQRSNSNINNFSVTLKSALGVKKITLDNYSSLHFSQQNIKPGDIIIIEVNSGNIQRLGRCDNYSTEYDLECERYVPLPKSEIYQRKFGVKDVTLFDIDKANSETANEFQNSSDLTYQNFNFNSENDGNNVNDSLKEEINKTIKFYEMRGNAQIYPGIIVIRDAHLLKEEKIQMILEISENVKYAPNFIFISSRPFEGSVKNESKNRFLVVESEENSAQEIAGITENRLKAEGWEIGEDEKRKIEKWSEESGNAWFGVQKFKIEKIGGLRGEEMKEMKSGRELVKKISK